MAVQTKCRLNYKPEWCKGCGICVEFCPRQVLALNELGKIEIRNPEKCGNCGLCIVRCPDFALQLGGNKSEKD